MGAAPPPATPWSLPHACGPSRISPTHSSFRIWAPHGLDVRIQFRSGETLALVRSGDFWEASAACAVGDEYRVTLGSSWNDCFAAEGAELVRRDPCARECGFENDWCVVPSGKVVAGGGVDDVGEMVIYEMHLGTWVGKEAEAEGSVFLEGADKLQYVADLGFNTVQLMPTTLFGGLWGYNSSLLLAVHTPWGRADDLRAFVRRAHELGLNVLFDVVLNHGSAKRNSLWNWDGFGKDNCGGIYFEGEKDTPWGRRFAFHKPEIRDYLKHACRVWIEEYGCDGLRMDSVHNMPWYLLKDLTREIREHYPRQALIAEITPENPAVVHDAGFNACWVHATHFDSLKIMKKFDGGEDGGRRLSMLKGMATLHGGRFGSAGGVQSVLGSHDQVGDRKGGNQDGRGTHRYYVSRLGGRENWHARAQTRAWFCFQNCILGMPMTFQGTETLQDGWWHLDDQHRFQWRLTEGGDSHAADMMRTVTASNLLRRSSKAFTGKDLRIVHEDASHSVLGFVRWVGEEAFLCVMHLSDAQWHSENYCLRTGWGGKRQWKLVLNSQAKKFGGWEGSCSPEALSNDDGGIHISLPKWSCVVYKSGNFLGEEDVQSELTI